jgi:hypothetical protein
MDVLNQIILDEKIENLDDEFSKIDSEDYTLYAITNSPKDVQKYNPSSSLISFSKIFDKKDLFEFKKQIISFDTSLRPSRFIKDKRVNFSTVIDSSKKINITCYLSYPLFNKQKNAVIVFLDYYGGDLFSGQDVLIYAKKSNKWIRLSRIVVIMS